MKAKNIDEFKELIEKYESITIEEIRKARRKDLRKNPGEPFYNANVAEGITGFGTNSGCTLCIAVVGNCKKCIYKIRYGCLSDKNEETYDAIDVAESPKKLLKAFKARAVHMKTLI